MNRKNSNELAIAALAAIALILILMFPAMVLLLK